jgi:hypothetical protein
MPLDVNTFKTIMMTATLNKTNAAEALSSLGSSIATYIMTNALITFSWNGIQPPTDPTTTATGKILGLVFTLTPSGASDQSTAINFLKNQFIAGLVASTYNITDPGFTTTPAAMATSPNTSNLNLVITADNRDGAFQQLAISIIDWIKIQIPTGAILGSHGSFVAPPGSGGLVLTIL